MANVYRETLAKLIGARPGIPSNDSLKSDSTRPMVYKYGESFVLFLSVHQLARGPPAHAYGVIIFVREVTISAPPMGLQKLPRRLDETWRHDSVASGRRCLSRHTLLLFLWFWFLLFLFFLSVL